MSNVKINIEEIIRFYDNKEEVDKSHASAITGLAGEDLAAGLIVHYFNNRNKNETCTIVKNDKKQSDHSVSEEKKNGKKLDRWICVKEGNNKIYYQTEIKNWSSHSKGGEKVSLDIEEQKLINLSRKMFQLYCNCENEKLIDFHDDSINKVLLKMNNPSGYNEQNDTIEPLVCFWFPVLSPTLSECLPFFSVQLNEKKFKNLLHFFSMSIYLRNLLKTGVKEIDIEMPNFTERVKKLNGMFNYTLK